MAVFWPKPWVNPFGEISIFRLFELLFFMGQKDVFLFQNSVKQIFLAYIALKKDMEKWPFFDQNHGLTPLEKSQFFDFLNFVFWGARKAFFVLEYCKTHFPSLYCLKQDMEKWPFFDLNYGLTPLEQSQFFDFLNMLFLQGRQALFCSGIL